MLYSYQIFLSIFLLIVALFVLGFSFSWLFNVTFGGLDFVSGKKIAQIVGSVLVAHNLENGRLYDLGSCRGSFIFSLQKFCPRLRITGIDDSLFRVMVSKLRGYFYRSSAAFIRDDFFKADISSANAVFLYLESSLLPDLEIKLKKQLKPGSLVITHRVSFLFWQPLQSFPININNPERRVFVYVV